ncbi:MAG: transcriptional regulator [Austwickia sp.]|nr:MAG: transcriptional regulator [Austwickia sp.]
MDKARDDPPLGLPAPRLGNLSREVRASWRRCLAWFPEPAKATTNVVLAGSGLRDYRESHPLSAVMPVLRRLLVDASANSDIIVAVGDAEALLLWVEGAPEVRRRAERIGFQAGADWSESAVGTAAPGTALFLGRGVQVMGQEHFSPEVRRWSCTAVPIHDPATGDTIGVVDLTGGPQAVAPHALPLVRAAVAAAEAELTVQRLRGLTAQAPVGSGTSAVLPAPRGAGGSSIAARGAGAELRVLGRDTGILVQSGVETTLSLRHTEILLMLARHPAGLRLEELLDLVNPDASVVTLRAEMARLRRMLEACAPRYVPRSRPYRLPTALATDADLVMEQVERGRHRAALSAYAGPLLPTSRAPGVERLRARVSGTIRDTILESGSVDALLQFLELADAGSDADAWLAALRRLPARSPKRARIVRHLEWLEQEYGG